MNLNGPTNLVSIIIPTWNSSSVLTDCLNSLRLQTYSNIEIIVADNYSTDTTTTVAKNFNARLFVYGPIPPNNTFFSAPERRRIGAEKAFGDYLFFVDSDMILDIGLIQECVLQCQRSADAIIVPEVSFGEGFWSECRIYERKCDIFFDQTIQERGFVRLAILLRKARVKYYIMRDNSPFAVLLLKNIEWVKGEEP